MNDRSGTIKITYELSCCFDCKIRDRNSVMSFRHAQTSVSTKRMPAKILMRSLEASHSLIRDEMCVGWMWWTIDVFPIVSSFFAKSNEARRNNLQKGRYAFKRAFDRGIESVMHFGLLYLHNICCIYILFNSPTVTSKSAF